MAGFGDVLRRLGSVLNPQVAQELAQEERAKEAQQNQLGMFALQQHMQKMSPEYQAREEAVKNERAYRTALSELGPDADFDVMAQLAVKHGKPEVAAGYLKAKEDRAARVQMASDNLEARRLQITQNHELALQRISDQKERSAETGRHNRAMEALGKELAKVRVEALTQGKVLPGTLQKQLTEAAEMDDATQRFTSTFKNDYGGYKIAKAGDAMNWIKRTFGDESGQAQWWQDYELHQSQVRNKLFGSALTAPEIAAWNKSAINPGMDPGEIKKNLGRRAELERVAINRLMKGAAAGGYKKEQIEAFTGRSIPGGEAGSEPSIDDLLKQYGGR